MSIKSGAKDTGPPSSYWESHSSRHPSPPPLFIICPALPSMPSRDPSGFLGCILQ